MLDRLILIIFLSMGMLCIPMIQAQNIIPNQLIVRGQLSEINRFLDPLNQRVTKSKLQYQTLSGDQNLYLYQVPPEGSSQLWIERLKKAGIRAYPNRKLSKRNTPNDEKIKEQWALSSIGAIDTWNETIGEFDFGGEKPVIAIMDDGYDITHEDLMDNVFINGLEIPDNGVDDDGNGYIDDYQGFHTETENDQHPVLNHGTSVAGIIAAKGNNGVGISGLLWHSKVLLISGITSEADVLIAYDYIYMMRKLYDDTNGQKGAYIVCNNFSGGLDNAWAREHVDWCDQYDRLGELGILSVGAATNNDVNIDDVGDMPATCSSPYLVIVHDINELGQRAKSGRSNQFVDLAAPGENILSIEVDNQYKLFKGTSAAAPFVAGAIQLIYTAPCETFYKRLKDDPPVGARIIKEALLSGSKKLPTLVAQNISEGSLDIFGSLARISSLCEQDLGELQINKIYQSGNNLRIDYQTDKFADHTLLIHNSIGQEVYNYTFKATLFADRTITISSANLSNGIYFATLLSDEVIQSKVFYLH